MNSLKQILDIGNVFHQHKSTPALQQILQCQQSLPTADKIKSSTRIRDMEILGEGTVVFQHHSNPMTVHPFLPAEQNILDAMQILKY